MIVVADEGVEEVVVAVVTDTEIKGIVIRVVSRIIVITPNKINRVVNTVVRKTNNKRVTTNKSNNKVIRTKTKNSKLSSMTKIPKLKPTPKLRVVVNPKIKRCHNKVVTGILRMKKI